MSDETRACPVCGKPGFEINCLPKDCPQCSWRVENLPAEPSEAYQLKLTAARNKWQKSDGPHVKAEQLKVLFEQTKEAWKTGAWEETLRSLDKIAEIDPDNIRITHERWVAIFCLMESILVRHCRARLEVLWREIKMDRMEMDLLADEAIEFDSVGMAKEASAQLEKVAELSRRIELREKNAKDLYDIMPDHFIRQYQNDYPEAVLSDMSSTSDSIFSSLKQEWTDERFNKLIWLPFMKEISELPDGERHYAEEFRQTYSGQEEALEALREAEKMIESGNYRKAGLLINRARYLYSALSSECDSTYARLIRARRETGWYERATIIRICVILLFIVTILPAFVSKGLSASEAIFCAVTLTTPLGTAGSVLAWTGNNTTDSIKLKLGFFIMAASAFISMVYCIQD